MPSKTEDAAAGAGAGSSANTPADRSIGTAINVATRSVHTKLNKLIIMRLRLALPPQADDASNYVQGLLHITPIYQTFESLWQDILDADPVDTPREPAAAADDEDKQEDTNSEDSEASDDSQPPTACSRIHLLLFQLRSEKMLRTSALRRDLAALTGWSDAVLAEQLDEIVSESPLLTEFVQHIKKAVAKRPHVLLAYAWVLYMALFSGGRFIRASLERVDAASPFWTPLAAAGSSSGASETETVVDAAPAVAQPAKSLGVAMLGPWLANQVGLGGIGMGANKDKDKTQKATGKPQPQQQQHHQLQQPKPQLHHGQSDDDQQPQHPLAFFRFATPSDGEDLKQTFKARLAEATSETSAGNLLSTQERADVVAEAQLIFDYMIRAVGELDEVCGTEEETEGVARALSLRSRDSVVVEKEKRRRLAVLIASTPAGREALKGNGKTEAEKETTRETAKGESSGNKNGNTSKGAMRFT
ncbi:hypothetical protein F4821DRAFT_166929 [Hypoxylon rubiginosum]|uniref:Uncharacterized protein n=1 Tax=Hypoxylon rubiginosum TaxID=110542 RepID=A0ACC0CWV4_9PEZI|nr:hypothetical protein F4821DRAFT_166929 [Hypoxylon rubiginosum]